jgi:hypothetical protein
VIVGVTAGLVTCVSMILAHGLWERTYSRSLQARERVILINLATTITIAIGVLTLFVMLFVINLVSAGVLITTHVLEKQLGHAAGFGTYLSVAWLVTTLATLGGALGAAVENDRAVREAAYGYHPDARTEAMQDRPAEVAAAS